MENFNTNCEPSALTFSIKVPNLNSNVSISTKLKKDFFLKLQRNIWGTWCANGLFPIFWSIERSFLYIFPKWNDTCLSGWLECMHDLLFSSQIFSIRVMLDSRRVERLKFQVILHTLCSPFCSYLFCKSCDLALSLKHDFERRDMYSFA